MAGRGRQGRGADRGDGGGRMVLRKRKPTGANSDACHVEGGKGGTNGQGQRRQKQARGAGLQGPRGTLGSRSRAARK